MELTPIDVIRLRALGVREEASQDKVFLNLREDQMLRYAQWAQRQLIKRQETIERQRVALSRAERARTVWMLATASGWLAAIGAVVWGWR